MSELQRGRVSFSIDRPWPTDAPFTHGHDGRSRSGVKDAAALSLATLTSASSPPEQTKCSEAGGEELNSCGTSSFDRKEYTGANDRREP